MPVAPPRPAEHSPRPPGTISSISSGTPNATTGGACTGFLKDELGVVARLRHAAGLQPGAHPGRTRLPRRPFLLAPPAAFPAGRGIRNDWYVDNVALVNSPGGTLAGLAARRVAGMAYTVSEYNHPEPNQYAAEGFPDDRRLRRVPGVGRHLQLRLLPQRRLRAAADRQLLRHQGRHRPAGPHAGLRGDVPPRRRGPGQDDGAGAAVAPGRNGQAPRDAQRLHSLTTSQFGLDPRLSLLHAIALDLSGRTKVGEAARSGRTPRRSSPTRARSAGTFRSRGPASSPSTRRGPSSSPASSAAGPSSWATSSWRSARRSSIGPPCRSSRSTATASTSRAGCWWPPPA